MFRGTVHKIISKVTAQFRDAPLRFFGGEIISHCHTGSQSAAKLISPYEPADTNQEGQRLTSTVIVIVSDMIPLVTVLFCY